MAYEPTLSFHEILIKVNNAKDKTKKIEVLRRYDTKELRAILKAAFDPKVEFALPKERPPFTINDAPTGTEHTWLKQEVNRLYHFIVGGNDELTSMKKETMFVQMLEGLSTDEAELLLNIKYKKLNTVYKGLTEAVVREAFHWNENFMRRNN